MVYRVDELPDLTRTDDVAAVLFSHWAVGSAERQDATIESTGDVWNARPWPHRHLLSYSMFACTDGDYLLNYTQWSQRSAHEVYVRTERKPRINAVDEAVRDADVHGETQRLGVVYYRRYRGTERIGPDVPGCHVVVIVEFDGPDERRQKRWADGALAAMDAAGTRADGLIAAHLHLSDDGTRVLNFAEWESDAAHENAADVHGLGFGSGAPEWRAMERFPGVTGVVTRRYHFQLNLLRAGDEVRA